MQQQTEWPGGIVSLLPDKGGLKGLTITALPSSSKPRESAQPPISQNTANFIAKQIGTLNDSLKPLSDFAGGVSLDKTLATFNTLITGKTESPIGQIALNDAPGTHLHSLPQRDNGKRGR